MHRPSSLGDGCLRFGLGHHRAPRLEHLLTDQSHLLSYTEIYRAIHSARAGL
jgi:hypothetical protein